MQTVSGVWIFVRQEWYDYRLSWNATEYGGVQSIRLPSSLIWTPDILLYNRFEAQTPSLSIFFCKWICRTTSSFVVLEHVVQRI